MRIITPLRQPPVALLWGGLSLSALGDQLYTVALSWIAVRSFGAAAGYLNALGVLALLLAALTIGRWSDHWEQRAAMIGADLLRAGMLCLLVLAWVATGAPSAPALALTVAVLGVGQAVFRPALQALLPVLVALDDLPAANALFDTTDRIARLIGPGVIGLLAGLLPVRHFFTLDAVSFALSAAAIALGARLRPVPPIRRAAPKPESRIGIAHGFEVVARHKLLRFVLLTSGFTNGAWFATLFLGLPLLIERAGITGPGGTGLGAFGLVISSYGCTNLAATLWIGNRAMPVRPGRQIFAGDALLGTGLVLLALAPVLWPRGWLLPGLCLGAAIAAPGGPMHDVPVAVLRQTELPRQDVPAAMRAFMVAGNLGILAAMLAAPLMFTALPLVPASALCGVMAVGVGLAGLLRVFNEGVTGSDGPL